MINTLHGASGRRRIHILSTLTASMDTELSVFRARRIPLYMETQSNGNN